MIYDRAIRVDLKQGDQDQSSNALIHARSMTPADF